MKELIRSLRLSKLSDALLTNELKKLDETIHFIQTILDKMILKIDKVKYSNYEFYFIGNENYFQYNLKNTGFYCGYEDFWVVLETRFHYKNEEIVDLVKEVVEEHFKNKVVTPQPVTKSRLTRVEEHFKNI